MASASEVGVENASSTSSKLPLISVLIVVSIIGCSIVQSCWKDYDCSHNLNDGYWMTGNKWQSYHCIIHQYKESEVSNCLERWDRILVIGGVRAKEYFKLMRTSNNQIDFVFHSELNNGTLQEYHNLVSLTKSDTSVLVIHHPEEFAPSNGYSEVEVEEKCKDNLLGLLNAQEMFLKSMHHSSVILLTSHVLKGGCSTIAKKVYLNKSDTFLFYLNTPAPIFPITTTFPLELNFILNSYCNTPLEATCCVQDNGISYTATSLLMVLLALFLGFYLVHASGATFALIPYFEAKLFDIIKFFSALNAAGSVVAVLLYIQMADRLDYFTRLASFPNLLFCGILVSGSILWTILTLKDSGQKEVLSRCQCDEWRGCMMISLIILKYNGIVQESQKSTMISIVIGVFLFLNGYCYFTSLWSKNIISWKKSVLVLIRLNLIPICVSLSLDNQYGMYYLLPLLSISYIFVIIFMTTCPVLIPEKIYSGTLHLRVLLKFFIFFLIILILPLFKMQIEIVLSFIGHSDNLYFWIESQRFNSLWGMLIGYFIAFKKSNSLSMVNEHLLLLRIGAIICGLLIIPIYILVTSQFTNPSFQGYFAILPILSYIILRNGYESMQNYYSTFLSNLGGMSTWIFVCHYHILLAFDGKGILVLFPKLYLLNDFIVTMIFVGIVVLISHSLYILKKIDSLKYFVFVTNV